MQNFYKNYDYMTATQHADKSAIFIREIAWGKILDQPSRRVGDVSEATPINVFFLIIGPFSERVVIWPIEVKCIQHCYFK